MDSIQPRTCQGLKQAGICLDVLVRHDLVLSLIDEWMVWSLANNVSMLPVLR